MEEFSKKFVVATKDTAKSVGSGDLDVLATPTLLTFVEHTAKEWLQSQLATEETSVGTAIEVKHFHPSTVGATIEINLKVISQEKMKINFSFTAIDGKTAVASGTHQRAIVITDVFLSKLKSL